MSADADGSYKMVRARSKRIIVGQKWEKIAAKVVNDYFTLHSPPPTPQAATAEPLEDLSSSQQAQSD